MQLSLTVNFHSPKRPLEPNVKTPATMFYSSTSGNFSNFYFLPSDLNPFSILRDTYPIISTKARFNVNLVLSHLVTPAQMERLQIWFISERRSGICYHRQGLELLQHFLFGILNLPGLPSACLFSYVGPSLILPNISWTKNLIKSLPW